MNPYDTQPRKIDTFQNEEINYSIEEELQSREDDAQEEEVQRNNVLLQELEKITDRSTDWEVLDQEIQFGESKIQAQYKSWTVHFDVFDIRLIPYINVRILYRASNGDIDDSDTVSFSSFSTNIDYALTDIEGEEYYKGLTVVASLQAQNPNITVPYEARFLFNFINPRAYI